MVMGAVFESISPAAGRRCRAVLAVAALLLAQQTHALSCGDVAPDASRIAVAGGSLAEILYAMGEESRIVAVDRTATYPEAARALPQIGYVRDLSAEGILSLKPTLVLGEHDMGPPEVVAQLESLGVDMLLVPERFDVSGVVDKVRCVAAAVGNVGAGEALVEQLSAPLAQVQAEAPKVAGLVLLGVRGGAPLAAGRDTSGDGLLAMAGVRNVMRDFAGWKGVSEEAMLLAAPEFIVVPQRGVDDAGGVDALLEHPALRLTPAARERRVIVMDGMAMLGFGPRTVEAAARLQSAVSAAAGAAP
jgi:iron complex transport system substrate-binding protein